MDEFRREWTLSQETTVSMWRARSFSTGLRSATGSCAPVLTAMCCWRKVGDADSTLGDGKWPSPWALVRQRPTRCFALPYRLGALREERMIRTMYSDYVFGRCMSLCRD